MPLIKRNRSPQIPANEDVDKSAEEVDEKNRRRWVVFFRKMASIAFVLVGIAAVLAKSNDVRTFRRSFLEALGTYNKSSPPESSAKVDLEHNSFVYFEWTDSNQNGVVTAAYDKSCKTPRLWTRVEGDALLGVTLVEQPKGNLWRGTFEIPISGNFKLVAHWYGCSMEGSSKKVIEIADFQAARKLQATDSRSTFHRLFPSAMWLSTKRFYSNEEAQSKQPYIWTNPDTPQNSIIIETPQSMVAKNGTVGANEYHSFRYLSNYEIVCWLGSESAKDLWTAFKEMRPHVANRQRPFKFHYYPMHSFQTPNKGWEGETPTRFRKCKHIFVSMDEPEQALSYSDYKNQVQIFLHHLLQAFPDKTFPIWMFTAMDPPAMTKNCFHLPTGTARSTEHPCNVALKELFQSQADNKDFSERVQLLDTTDLSLSQLDENRKDVLSVAAMRIFVLVGKQVREWRSHNQVGTVKGLQRGDVLEPNFELVPYTDWGLK